MIGDDAVGKSMFLWQFADARFSSSYGATICFDKRLHFLELAEYNFTFKLQIWDLSGWIRFRTATYAYYRGADAIMLFYDITDRASFEHIKEWKKNVDNLAQPNAVTMLVGTKLDAVAMEEAVDAQWRVSTVEAQECCDELGLFKLF